MKKVHITGIRWDADNPEDISHLSSEMILDVPEHVKDEDELEEFIEDELSNQSGFCHAGWERAEILKPEKTPTPDFNDSKTIIYEPENSDEGYTGKMFLDLCGGNENIAQRLYDNCEWQAPETILDEWKNNGLLTKSELGIIEGTINKTEEEYCVLLSKLNYNNCPIDLFLARAHVEFMRIEQNKNGLDYSNKLGDLLFSIEAKYQSFFELDENDWRQHIDKEVAYIKNDCGTSGMKTHFPAVAAAMFHFGMIDEKMISIKKLEYFLSVNKIFTEIFSEEEKQDIKNQLDAGHKNINEFGDRTDLSEIQLVLEQKYSNKIALLTPNQQSVISSFLDEQNVQSTQKQGL